MTGNSLKRRDNNNDYDDEEDDHDQIIRMQNNNNSSNNRSRKALKLSPATRLSMQEQRKGDTSTSFNKRDSEVHQQHQPPQAIRHGNPRSHTISVAISATSLSHLEKPELRTYCAGQIGRALSLMEVDEVIVYLDAPPSEGVAPRSTTGHFESAAKKNFDPQLFLARLLEYLETPSYLRKALFPVHRDLQYAGLMNPLEAPHHVKIDTVTPFREGVTLADKVSHGTLVDCGMRKLVQVETRLKPNVRVTVKITNSDPSTSSYHNNNAPYISGTIVSPHAPTREGGMYWGYKVRLAPSISSVMNESPFEGGYDLKIGVSENAPTSFSSISTLSKSSSSTSSSSSNSSGFQHALVVLGGTKGLEYSVECDEDLPTNECVSLFDYYIRALDHMGSRIVRTEENVIMSMTAIIPKLS